MLADSAKSSVMLFRAYFDGACPSLVIAFYQSCFFAGSLHKASLHRCPVSCSIVLSTYRCVKVDQPFHGKNVTPCLISAVAADENDESPYSSCQSTSRGLGNALSETLSKSLYCCGGTASSAFAISF